MVISMEVETNNSKLTQKQIGMMGFSDSTSKRYENDMNIDSPDNRNFACSTNQKENDTPKTSGDLIKCQRRFWKP